MITQVATVIRVCSPKEVEDIDVYLRLYNGNGCKLSINKNMTLSQFRKVIEEAEIQINGTYQIIFQGKILNKETQTLSNLNISNGSIIHIDSCHDLNPKKLKLDVCFFYKGEKTVIRASKQQTIFELKTKIYRLINILPKNQMIIFRGQKLQDNKTLSHYHIQQDSLLCLSITQQIEEQNSVPNPPFIQNRELISGTVSVNFQKLRENHKSNVFRSQSLGTQKQPFQVQIHEQNREQLLESRDFKYQLFTPMMPFISELEQSVVSNKENISSSSISLQLPFKIMISAPNQLLIK